MALICEPSSSVAPLDKTPCKIKVQLMRMWIEGKKKKQGNSIEMLLLESSGTRINTTIDEAFTKWIMDLSDEKINDGYADIDIRKDLLPTKCGDPIKTIVRIVYGDSFAAASYPDVSHGRAILCHFDADVDQINDYMLSLLPGEEKLCYSDDCLPPRDGSSNPSAYMFLFPRFFGSIDVPGVPRQILRLKVGAPVMLLMDIDPSRGLCKGTRLEIIMLGDSMVEARFPSPTCSNYYETAVIPKMHMSPTEGSFLIPMRRTQYPLTLAFAMTINESQGQTLSKVGLYLPRTHGQRYVAISKVKARTGLNVLIADVDAKPQEDAENVVFKDL